MKYFVVLVGRSVHISQIPTCSFDASSNQNLTDVCASIVGRVYSNKLFYCGAMNSFVDYLSLLIVILPFQSQPDNEKTQKTTHNTKFQQIQQLFGNITSQVCAFEFVSIMKPLTL